MTTAPIRAGLVGCGNIGSRLAAFLCGHPGFRLVTLTDASLPAAQRLQAALPGGPRITTLDEALQEIDLVIECAGRTAALQVLDNPQADLPGMKLLFLSSGALAG